jgi:hypothetical protein
MNPRPLKFLIALACIAPLAAGCGDLLQIGGDDLPPASCPRIDEAPSPDADALECSEAEGHAG